MLPFLRRLTLLTTLILLTGCGRHAASSETPNPEAASSFAQSSAPAETNPLPTEPVQPTIQSFKSELAFDVNAYEDQLTENERPVLEVLKSNLAALVAHDHKQFRSGFVSEKLADAMEVYYGEHLFYRFTGIENVERFTTPHPQVHLFIEGERLDTTTDTVEEVKLMYAIQRNEQGVWSIETID